MSEKCIVVAVRERDLSRILAGKNDRLCGLLSLMRIMEELFQGNSGSGLEN
jgi:hypothetical protein